MLGNAEYQPGRSRGHSTWKEGEAAGQNRPGFESCH